MVVEGLKMLLLLPTWKRRWVCRVYAKQVWSANVRRCCHHCRRYIRIDSASVEFCRRCRNGIRPRQRALCWAMTNEPALCHRWYGHTRMERIRHRIRVYLATTCSLPAEAYRSPKSYHPPIRERRNNRMTHTIFLVQELKDGKTVADQLFHEIERLSCTRICLNLFYAHTHTRRRIAWLLLLFQRLASSDYTVQIMWV